MAKRQDPIHALLDMEGDLTRVPRLFDAVQVIALAGVESPGGLSRYECEALHEIAKCGDESAQRTIEAWNHAIEMVRLHVRSKENANV
jgi:hypothetical protein